MAFTIQRVSPSPDLARVVGDLAAAARAHDGYAPLSEQYLLALSPSGEAAQDDEPDAAVTHLLARDHERVLGYAQVRPGAAGEPAAAELVVDPGGRLGGIGTALVEALPPQTRIWAHGDTDATRGFTVARGLTPVRSLLVLGRSLESGPPWSEPVVPDRYVVRSFEPGRDEAELLRVNAAAFAHHPEQGSLDLAGLHARMALPWFRADGLVLVVLAHDPSTVAAFHWTKIDPPGSQVGEVYVVGIDPAHQGQGLARPLTALGLEHLRAAGCTDVILYVDEENLPAVRTYRGMGFTDREVHRQYVRDGA